MTSHKKDIYAPCKHIERLDLKDVAMDKDGDFQTSDMVLPLYEKRLFDHLRVKYSSLKSNQALACRWREYVANMETRVRSPFQFPKSDDLHFYNQQMRYDPNLSINTKPDHRIRFAPGPGVDCHGRQLPIPDDMQMKRYQEPTKVANNL